MLGGWLWHRGMLRRMKKRLYWEAMVKSLARRASVIHALSFNERDVLRRDFFPNERIEVIPNGISVTELDELSRHPEVEGHPEQRYILFLGRIHPVKGLERLLDAFAYCGTAERLFVAGSSHSERYMNQLLVRVRRLGIGSRVRFWGYVAGADKWRLLRGAWAVCSPSFSEGMSMVTLEAMTVRTPVISSVQTAILGWKDGGGLVFENDPYDIGRALKNAFSWSASERFDRGAAARALVERNYDWSVVGPQYLDLYHGLLA
jgi:glycosyltransferase involved in cell wall biosynthesis